MPYFYSCDGQSTCVVLGERLSMPVRQQDSLWSACFSVLCSVVSVAVCVRQMDRSTLVCLRMYGKQNPLVRVTGSAIT